MLFSCFKRNIAIGRCGGSCLFPSEIDFFFQILNAGSAAGSALAIFKAIAVLITAITLYMIGRWLSELRENRGRLIGG